NGASWRKIYSNDNRNARVWNWHTRVDPGHGWLEFNLAAGLNELRVSGRSQNFKLDRLHIYPRGVGRLEDLSLAESPRTGERPVLGTTVDLRIGDPHDQARLSRTTQALLLVAPSPHPGACGTPWPAAGAGGGPAEFLLDPSGPF